MPTLEKLLRKFNGKERAVLIALIEKIVSLNWRSLDVKKLKGYSSFFRLRKGDFRIIFEVQKNKTIYILAIERRSEKTYRDY